MCLCLRRKQSPRSDSPEHSYYSPQPVKTSSDDLSTAFQSLSIQSEPATTFKTTTPIQYVQPIPSPITSPIPTPLPKPIPIATPVPKTATFPMPHHPRCRRCKWIPKFRDNVKINNPNGNAGRPYFICIKCKSNDNVPLINGKKGWISWDDYIGIHPSNRPCYCGFVSRQDRAGVDSYYPGGGFWTCATGSCSFLSYRRDALTDEEAYKKGLPRHDGFEPWLL